MLLIQFQFSAVLNHFLTGLDRCIDAQHTDKNATCDWLKIQELALSEDNATIKKYVLQAQRLSVKLPVMRKVSHKTNLVINDHTFKPGEMVVCDIVSSLPCVLPTISFANINSALMNPCYCSSPRPIIRTYLPERKNSSRMRTIILHMVPASVKALCISTLANLLSWGSQP